ncbi:amphi-Trp domain-containing protein [Halobacteriaceae archaeon GCM10025711]
MAELEAEQQKTRAEIAAYLREFADELATGEKVTLLVGEDSATVNPPETLTFGVEVEQDSSLLEADDEQSVSFELEWVREEREETDDELDVK